MKLIAVFKKSMIEQFRDYKALILTILSPIVFIVIFGLAFGQGFYTYTLGITNEDQGKLGNHLIQNIENSQYPNGNKIFETIIVNNKVESLDKGIKQQKYDAHLFIPINFSQSFKNSMSITDSSNDSNRSNSFSNSSSSSRASQDDHAAIVISGNPSNLTYNLISSFLENQIHSFVWENVKTKNPTQIVYDHTGFQQIQVKSEFDNMAPGLIVFSVFFLMILSAMMITKEIENGTIQRIVLAKIKPMEICGGISLAQMVLAAIMIPLVFAASMLLGFHTSGSFLLAYVVSLIATFSAIGIGLIIAAFCKTSLEAFIIGNVVLTPMMFLAGIFFKVPPIKLFTIMDKEIELLSFIPTLDAVSAMNKILLQNAGFYNVVSELIVLIILSAFYFLLGVVLFKRRYMARG
jgi:ABC-2 type transport system permease protein